MTVHTRIDCLNRYLALVLYLACISVCVGGCTPKPESGHLSTFADAYGDFEKALKNARVLSWVITLDQQGKADDPSTPVTGYRKQTLGAINLAVSDTARSRAAQGALEQYSEQSENRRHELEGALSKLDQETLALIEMANTMDEADDKSQAGRLANIARELDGILEDLNSVYGDAYERQNAILKSLVDSDGSLQRSSFGASAPDVVKLWNQESALHKKEEATDRKLDEACVALRGRTRISIACDE